MKQFLLGIVIGVLLWQVVKVIYYWVTGYPLLPSRMPEWLQCLAWGFLGGCVAVGAIFVVWVTWLTIQHERIEEEAQSK